MDKKENNEVINEEEVREDSELEIDLSKLSEEEQKACAAKFPKGMLIFIIVLLVLIVGLSIAVALID